MKTLPATFTPYKWAPSTADIAGRLGLDPIDIVRFDGNVPPSPRPSARPANVVGALARVN